MADSYFSGLGVAASTAVTNSNINTDGNHDAALNNHTVAWSGSTPTATYQRPSAPQGPGLTISAVGDGTNNAVGRLDLTHPATRGHAVQVLYTPTGAPTGADDGIIVSRSFDGTTSTFSGYVFHTTGNVLSLRNASSTAISGGATPTLTSNQTYQIDVVVDTNPTSPSTTNGRAIFRVKNLSSSSWNTTGEFFFDTGYTVNVGITNHNIWRVGKTSNTSVHGNAHYSGIRWGERTAVNTSTVEATAKAQFITASSGDPTVDLTASGVRYYISAVGTAPNGGALTYSITQTSGTSATPTLVATGKWVVVQDTTGPRVYQVTVSETGFGSTTNTVTVPAASSAASGQFVRKRLVGGTLV